MITEADVDEVLEELEPLVWDEEETNWYEVED